MFNIADHCLPCTYGVYNTHMSCTVYDNLCRRIKMIPDVPDIIQHMNNPSKQLTMMWTIQSYKNNQISVNILNFMAVGKNGTFTEKQTCQNSQMNVIKEDITGPALVRFIPHNITSCL